MYYSSLFIKSHGKITHFNNNNPALETETETETEAREEEEKAWQDFIERHGEIKGYAHFDTRTSLKSKEVQKLVCDRDWVKHHGFLPLIKHTTIKNNTTVQTAYGIVNIVNTRDVFYASHLDNCIYQRYAYLINKEYLKYINAHHFAQAVAAYRSDLGLSNIDFAKQVFDFIQQQTNNVVIISGDFSNFFSSLNHNYLKNKLCEILGYTTSGKLPADYFAVFKSITQFDYISDTAILKELIPAKYGYGHATKKDLNKRTSITSIDEFHKFKKHHIVNNSYCKSGIPQGVAISPVLSNVYMIDFDEAVNRICKLANGMYLRYSDDFIIIIPIYTTSSKLLLEKAGQYVDMLLAEVIKAKIELNLNKTHCMVLQQNQLYNICNIVTNRDISPYICNKPCFLDYLGFRFDGKSIKIHPHIIASYYNRLGQKALTIVKNNWMSPKGNHISAKNLYRLYSNDRNGSNIVRYLQRCKSLLKLNDPEAEAIINNSKHKIAVTLNRIEHKKQMEQMNRKNKKKRKV